MVSIDVGDGPIPAIVDTASPLTVLDPFEEGVALPQPRRRKVTLSIVGLDEGGQATIERARFPDTAALELHPCAGDQSHCRAGLGDAAVEFSAVVGTDILGRSAVRLDLAPSEMRFFPAVPGTDGQLTDDCGAVFSDSFAGGGTILVGGTEVAFSGRRPVLGACLDLADPPSDQEHGADAFFVLSTGTGLSAMAASSYDRYADRVGAPARAELPEVELHLISGPITARLGEIGRIALVGSLTEQTSDRGACRELYLNRLMSVRACEDPDSGIDECPCPDGDEFCRTAAAVDLLGPVPVALLDDDHPLFQALRTELRPKTPELDGILGLDALARLRLELDYPNGRMVMRCLVADGCTVLPAVRSRAAQAALDRCQVPAGDAGPIDGDAGPIDSDAGPIDSDAGPIESRLRLDADRVR